MFKEGSEPVQIDDIIPPNLPDFCVDVRRGTVDQKLVAETKLGLAYSALWGADLSDGEIKASQKGVFEKLSARQYLTFDDVARNGVLSPDKVEDQAVKLANLIQETKEAALALDLFAVIREVLTETDPKIWSSIVLRRQIFIPQTGDILEEDSRKASRQNIFLALEKQMDASSLDNIVALSQKATKNNQEEERLNQELDAKVRELVLFKALDLVAISQGREEGVLSFSELQAMKTGDFDPKRNEQEIQEGAKKLTEYHSVQTRKALSNEGIIFDQKGQTVGDKIALIVLKQDGKTSSGFGFGQNGGLYEFKNGTWQKVLRQTISVEDSNFPSKTGRARQLLLTDFISEEDRVSLGYSLEGSLQLGQDPVPVRRRGKVEEQEVLKIEEETRKHLLRIQKDHRLTEIASQGDGMERIVVLNGKEVEVKIIAALPTLESLDFTTEHDDYDPKNSKYPPVVVDDVGRVYSMIFQERIVVENGKTVRKIGYIEQDEEGKWVPVSRSKAKYHFTGLLVNQYVGKQDKNKEDLLKKQGNWTLTALKYEIDDANFIFVRNFNCSSGLTQEFVSAASHQLEISGETPSQKTLEDLGEKVPLMLATDEEEIIERKRRRFFSPKSVFTRNVREPSIGRPSVSISADIEIPGD